MMDNSGNDRNRASSDSGDDSGGTTLVHRGDEATICKGDLRNRQERWKLITRVVFLVQFNRNFMKVAAYACYLAC